VRIATSPTSAESSAVSRTSRWKFCLRSRRRSKPVLRIFWGGASTTCPMAGHRPMWSRLSAMVSEPRSTSRGSSQSLCSIGSCRTCGRLTASRGLSGMMLTGKPDFTLQIGDKTVVVECKNVRSLTPTHPQAGPIKVELRDFAIQRTALPLEDTAWTTSRSSRLACSIGLASGASCTSPRGS